MAATTANFGLRKPNQADTFGTWLEAHNANMDKIDALPLPVQSGSNTQLAYQKFSDGTLHMYGSVDYGATHPCTIQWTAAAGWASDDITLNFPVKLADTGYCMSAFVQTDKNPDIWCVSNKARSTSSFTFCFLCSINESTSQYGVNKKVLNLDIWGRWK